MRRSTSDLDHHADQRRRRAPPAITAPQKPSGVRPERLDQAVGDVDAQHVERAVREIHDPRHAEDQRQAGRHQEQRRGARQPVQELDEDATTGHAKSYGGRSAPARIRAGARGRSVGRPHLLHLGVGRQDVLAVDVAPVGHARPCRPSARCGRRRRPSSTGGRARGRSIVPNGVSTCRPFIAATSFSWSSAPAFLIAATADMTVE